MQTAVILLDIAYKPELSLAVSPAPAREGDTVLLWSGRRVEDNKKLSPHCLDVQL